MTAEEFWDYCQRPENVGRKLELIRGEVIELPSPTKRHGRVCLNVGYALESYARQVRKGYVLTNDAGVIIERDPDTVRGPDVAYYTDADVFNELDPKWGDIPPLLAVEVQSPADKQARLTKKISNYLDNGVKIVWLVNYEERFVAVHRVGRPPQVFECGQELTADELPGFHCLVDDFFRLPSEYPASPSSPPPPSA
jgi:Uma2 family endonuclease